MMARVLPRLAAVIALAAAAACSLRDAACGSQPQSNAPVATPEQVQATGGGPASPSRFKIVFLGDSLTAGLGLLSEQAYPVLIGQKFAAEGYANVEIVNAGISGDTTAGGARRVEDLLEPDVKILVVALGGNDALRGISTSQTHENLAAIIAAARAKGASVFLAGMEAPTNLGVDYQQNFHAIFGQLAHDNKDIVTLGPFLLEGVAGVPGLNQSDGIHPNPEGARIIAENLYPRLRVMVDSLGGAG
jgi:acyl-CoA thioesterase-1